MEPTDLNLELVTKIRGDGTTPHKVYDPRALHVLNAKPELSAWGWDHGRPIYHRLPMVGEAYQKSYDPDQAMVYLDPTIPIANGPGTLQVIKNQRDWRILDIMGGVISWRYGEFEVQQERINLTELNDGMGLQDGEYQVGYRLSHVDEERAEARFPGFTLAYAEEGNLSQIQVAYDSSGDTTDHRTVYALDQYDETSWWPNDYYGADSYLTGTHYTLDFLEPVNAEEFIIINEPGKNTANCALYESNDAIVWYKNDQVKSDSRAWTLNAQSAGNQYYRFHFWDGTASISSFTYTGQGYFRDNRVLKGDSSEELYLESLYEAIEGDYILLAHFTVKGGAVTNLIDHRRVTYERYQPVADWLTTFHDEQLRCNFDHVVYYSEQYMAPPTADFHLYGEMDDSLCTGLGEATLGNQDTVPVIRYPNVVGLLPDTSIDADMIEFLEDPKQSGDLTTMTYSEYTMYYSWSIDNGVYH